MIENALLRFFCFIFTWATLRLCDRFQFWTLFITVGMCVWHSKLCTNHLWYLFYFFFVFFVSHFTIPSLIASIERKIKTKYILNAIPHECYYIINTYSATIVVDDNVQYIPHSSMKYNVYQQYMVHAQPVNECKCLRAHIVYLL